MVAALVAVLLVAACAQLIGARGLTAAAPGETSFHTLHVGGRERSFLLHLPPAADSGRRVPLLLSFHGYTENANVNMEMTRLNEVGDRLGFAVAYLNGTGKLRFAGLTWNAATCCGSAERLRVNDVAFARAVVDTLAHALPVDSSRVFATGFSAGGMMSLLLACARRQFIYGAADVAGAMPDTTCATRARMAVLLVRGDEDVELEKDHTEHRHRNNHFYAVSFPGARRFWAAHNGCAPDARVDSTADYVLVSQLGCPPGRDVRELIVRGQGHIWPGGVRVWMFEPRPSPHVDASTIVARFLLDEDATARESMRAAHAGPGRR
ncbi:lipoprotein [Gemmatirosa kalamazoonensis]|uniref:Lipoprotein n=2 Tax=Gemmatirosa kalamazoonensis TaxID=861299 RepID=W0RJF4_9BACT|nr:lipoprotein [Gemmatirosa kalamazoonensis]